MEEYNNRTEEASVSLCFIFHTEYKYGNIGINRIVSSVKYATLLLNLYFVLQIHLPNAKTNDCHTKLAVFTTG